MKILKKGKPIFKIVYRKRCRRQIAIEEGDSIVPCEKNRNQSYVRCPKCKRRVVFKLRLPDDD